MRQIVLVISIIALVGVSFALGWLASTWRLGRVLSREPTSRQRRAARAAGREVRTAFGTGRDIGPRARDDFDFGEDITR
jgi:hypothetical protein